MDTIIDAERQKIYINTFNEFRSKFTQLVEENAEIRILLAGMGASVSSTQERIEERLKDIASALRESIEFSTDVQHIKNHIDEMKNRLDEKRKRLEEFEIRILKIHDNLLTDENIIRIEGKWIKIILLIMIVQVVAITYHLIFS